LVVYKYIYMANKRKAINYPKLDKWTHYFMVHPTHTKAYPKHLRPIIVGDSISIPTKLSSFALAIGKEITHRVYSPFGHKILAQTWPRCEWHLEHYMCIRLMGMFHARSACIEMRSCSRSTTTCKWHMIGMLDLKLSWGTHVS